MKFLHLADLHLGRSLGEFDLIEDQKAILEQIIDIIKERSIDCVLIAGDVYDKSIPSEAATNLFDWFLKELSQTGASTYIISGNHDSDDRLNFGSELFTSHRIFISAKYDGKLKRQTMTDEFGEVDIWLLPFVKASQVRHFYPEAKIDSYDDAVKTVIENAGIDTARRNVIVAHQYVTCMAKETELGGSESIGTQTVGTVEMISDKTFDPFDYVALGHIHRAQSIGRQHIRYAGSPLKYSEREINNHKSVTIVILNDRGSLDIEQVPLQPKRDVRALKGKLNDLLDPKNVSDTDDYIFATLTDEVVTNDAMGIFQQTYPRTVRIVYDNSHMKEIEQVDISNVEADRSFSELISDFYKLFYNEDISDEEMKVVKEVAREAGIIDEAD